MRKIGLELILLFLNITGLSIAIILYSGWWRAQKLPNNNPAKYVRKSQDSTLVVFVGDSITQGTIGASYVDLIVDKMDKTDFEFVNAGINGEVAWNVAQRLEEIIRLQPDIITLMIGTNDAIGSLSPKDAKLYRRTKGIPQDPSVEWYHENLTFILNEIQQKTSAKIALVSIPVLTEDPSHKAFERSIEISNAMKDVAHQFALSYIPFNEQMVECTKRNSSQAKLAFDKRIRAMFKATIKHYVFGRRWNQISTDSGFNLLIDNIHLNTIAASMASDLIHSFISGGMQSSGP
ncbi:MAG: GDSL-type esterase/lipase family protein [Candidatus Thorarchaeota archaeon]|nr:GDSL-type esterase/lipase family protein [Candidatus Thorarchaeota archaeon]